MPRYEFECQACRTAFELQASFAEYAAQTKATKLTCPQCQSRKSVAGRVTKSALVLEPITDRE